jgi:hypothetical protein
MSMEVFGEWRKGGETKIMATVFNTKQSMTLSLSHITPIHTLVRTEHYATSLLPISGLPFECILP